MLCVRLDFLFLAPYNVIERGHPCCGHLRHTALAVGTEGPPADETFCLKWAAVVATMAWLGAGYTTFSWTVNHTKLL